MKRLFAVLFSVLLILGLNQCSKEDIVYYGCTLENMNNKISPQYRLYKKVKKPITCQGYYEALLPLYYECAATMNEKDKAELDALLASLLDCFTEE